jgi:hypothetical protein
MTYLSEIARHGRDDASRVSSVKWEAVYLSREEKRQRYHRTKLADHVLWGVGIPVGVDWEKRKDLDERMKRKWNINQKKDEWDKHVVSNVSKSGPVRLFARMPVRPDRDRFTFFSQFLMVICKISMRLLCRMGPQRI